MSDTQTASFPTPLVGYTDAWSYTAGAEVTGYVSGDGGTVDISLVRLDRGLDERNRPPADFARIDWTGSGSHPLAQQVHHHGSFLLVPAVRSDAVDATGTFEAYSFGAWIWVASVLPGRQAVLSVAVEPEIGVGAGVGIDGTEDIAVEELVLGLSDGAPAVWLADAAGGRAAILAAADPIPTDSWHFLSLSARGGGLELRSSPRDALRGRTFSGRAPHARCVRAGGRITAAGSFGTVKRAEAELAIGAAVDLFTGKLDSPFLASRPLRDREHAELVAAGRIPESLVGDLVGLWSLAQHAGEPRAVVRSAAAGPGGRDGILVNQPMRAVTGHSWGSAGTSAAHRFADAPDDYDAVHFHRTDLGDVGWEPTFSARLPEDLPSGVYGIALRSDGGVSGPEEDLIPIYVVPGERAEQRPARGDHRADLPLPRLCEQRPARRRFRHGARERPAGGDRRGGSGAHRTSGLRALALRSARRRHRGLDVEHGASRRHGAARQASLAHRLGAAPLRRSERGRLAAPPRHRPRHRDRLRSAHPRGRTARAVRRGAAVSYTHLTLPTTPYV